MEDFDDGLNLDYHTKYDNQSDLAADIVGGGIATVADFGASVWNSLPGTEEVQTADLLRGINTDALRVYEENQDTIETLSFIGGMFVPAGLAFKGLQAARAGSKGINWFSKAGREADLAKIDELFAQGPTATKLYRQARNEFYLKGAANQLVDAVAMEAAIVGTLNAHPLMEDYMADPVKNFALGAAFGGVLGGALGRVTDGFDVKKLTSGIEGQAFKDIFKVAGQEEDAFRTAYSSTQTATQLQIQEINLQSLKKITEDPDGLYNGITKSYAEKIALDLKADQFTRFEGMLSPELRNLDSESKTALLQTFASNQTMNGVNEVAYLTQKVDGGASIIKGLQDNLKATAVFKTLTNLKTGEQKLREVAYFPEFNRFGTLDDAKHYTRARDLGLTPTQIDAGLGKDFGRLPNNNAYEEVLTKNSASLDKDYLAALKRVDSMDLKDIEKLAISPDDLPLINALVSRSAKDPEAFKAIKLTVTKNEPNWGAIEQAVHTAAGVAKDYVKKVDSWTNPTAMKQFDLATVSSSLSRASQDFIGDWISGNVKPLRDSAEAFFRGGFQGKQGADIAAEIYKSKEAVALRENFRSVADPDGYVYLYRGMNAAKAKGHAALESYTTNIEKAKQFGKPQLYKVHVDDILGGIRDIPGKDGIWYNEIIVGSMARPTVAALPVGQSQQIAKTASTTKSVMSVADLEQSLADLKGGLLNSMLKQGIPLETIAIRTNTPLDVVKAFSMKEEGTKLSDLGNWREYSDAASIDQYMAADKRALNLKSEIRKQSFSAMKAGFDAKTLTDIQHELTSILMSESKSQIAKGMGQYLFGSRKPMLDMLRTQISEFSNSNAGSKFLTSTDFFVRDMKEAGSIVSTIGKDMQHLNNEAIGKVLKPIKERMASIGTDPIALVEANTAVNLNASLKGWRIYKDRQFWQKTDQLDETGQPVLQPVKWGDQDYRVVSDKVDRLLSEMQLQGRELFDMKNTAHKILGKKDMNDLGFWIPAFNPKGKFVSYVWNTRTDGTSMLWANTAEELAEQERIFKTTVPASQLGKDIKVVNKSDQEAYNILNGRNDGLTMSIANVDLQKTGASAAANVKANTDIFSELAGGYEHYIGAQTRQLADISMHDITDLLDRMSSINQQYFKNQALSPVGKLLSQPKDTANVIKNTLLGNTNLNEYTNWRTANQSFETALSLANKAVSKVWDVATGPLTKGFLGKNRQLTPDAMEKMDYEALAKELEKQGIVNPWSAYDDEAAKVYGLAKLTDSKDVSKRLVYASNSFAATMALRIGELAQPIVNAMSLPILTSLAIANKMPDSFMGIQKGTAKVSGVQIMYEGAKASNDPKFKGLERLWTELGYFKPLVSEANETLAMARSFNPGIITKVEKALDSQLVNLMSKPADFSETVVRRQTMFTGAVLAKRLYPELDDMGVTIFARDFMDRAVGNYHAAQRPVMFQGTMGVALGLFQTYMLTLGQNVYRSLELKNYKALGKAALIQSSVFGTQSLPGFHMVSNAIGEHYSDNNVDLQTGTYRALNDTVADFVLYGLPSNLGPAFYSRGEIAPRVPNVIGGGIENIVGVNMMMQTADMAKRVASSFGNDYPEIARGFGEALSMQSMSRPIARAAELATGYSVTRAGNTVAIPEEVWTTTGVMSRLLSTRPMMEAKYREMQHLNSHYGSIDRENRQKLTAELKTSIRNGTLNDDLLGRLGEKYLREGGTPTGWRSAVNTALGQSNVSGKATLVSKLDPDSPLMHMMDSLD